MTVYEKILSKVDNKVELAKYLCYLTSCDGCIMEKKCSRGHNGFVELMNYNETQVWEATEDDD